MNDNRKSVCVRGFQKGERNRNLSPFCGFLWILSAAIGRKYHKRQIFSAFKCLFGDFAAVGKVTEKKYFKKHLKVCVLSAIII